MCAKAALGVTGQQGLHVWPCAFSVITRVVLDSYSTFIVWAQNSGTQPWAALAYFSQWVHSALWCGDLADAQCSVGQSRALLASSSSSWQVHSALWCRVPGSVPCIVCVMPQESSRKHSELSHSYTLLLEENGNIMLIHPHPPPCLRGEKVMMLSGCLRRVLWARGNSSADSLE